MTLSLKKQLCALTVLSAVAAPAMAESIDVRITGTITPSACTPTVTGGGTVDYGTISGDTLNVTSFTVLDQKTLPFTLTCDSPTRVALQTIDGRSGTAVIPVGSSVLGQAVTASTPMLGLGKAGDTNIGAFALSIPAASVTIDGSGSNVKSLSSSDQGTTWSNNTSEWVTDTADYFSWGNDGTTTPTAVTNLAGTLNVQAVINKTSALDLSSEVNLDGMATLEVKYL
jgi:hypothetical protein